MYSVSFCVWEDSIAVVCFGMSKAFCVSLRLYQSQLPVLYSLSMCLLLGQREMIDCLTIFSHLSLQYTVAEGEGKDNGSFGFSNLLVLHYHTCLLTVLWTKERLTMYILLLSVELEPCLFISATVFWLILTMINTMIARHIVMHYSFLSVSDYPLPFDNHHTQMCLDYKQWEVKRGKWLIYCSSIMQRGSFTAAREEK